MRKHTFNILGGLTILSWIFMVYFLFVHRPSTDSKRYMHEIDRLNHNVHSLESRVQAQMQENNLLLERLHKLIKGKATFEDITAPGGGSSKSSAHVKPENHPSHKDPDFPEYKPEREIGKDFDNGPSGNAGLSAGKRIDSPAGGAEEQQPVIAVLMFACNRVTVSKAIDSLLKARPSKEKFPIIVSQDCGHVQTADVIRGYGDEIIFIQQPDLSDIKDIPKKEKKFAGYFKISRHYKFGLNHTFSVLNYPQVIVVEDDLEVAPDFFEYFSATLPILKSDPSLFCVSAWNDNGKRNLIDLDKPEKLYRSDFFGGLGWMLTKEFWDSELSSKWPRSYWDDWMRQPAQRKNRACIRPEVSRTRTFGKIGVSQGLFFEKHLKFIQLNEQFVPFSQMDLNYLRKDNYDKLIKKEVNNARPVEMTELKRGNIKDDSVRLIYHTKEAFKRIAKAIGIMDDFKSGVPRTAYQGIVSVLYNGIRVYVAPNLNWKGYDESW